MVVLANSYKTGGRCIAGRELTVENGRNFIGPWIRPVSTRPEGELSQTQFSLDNGDFARVLDIIEFAIVERSNDTGQPENWLVNDQVTWSKIGTFPKNQICKLQETPSNLWLQQSVGTDRISVFAQSQGSSSLVVIKPENFTVRMFWEWNNYLNKSVKQTRATFQYASTDYSLSITDPEFKYEYCKNPPPYGAWHDVKEVKPEFADNCLLCISLGHEFHAFHYKLVATVLPLP